MTILFAHATGIPHHAEELTILRALIILGLAMGPLALSYVKSWFKKGK